MVNSEGALHFMVEPIHGDWIPVPRDVNEGSHLCLMKQKEDSALPQVTAFYMDGAGMQLQTI